MKFNKDIFPNPNLSSLKDSKRWIWSSNIRIMNIHHMLKLGESFWNPLSDFSFSIKMNFFKLPNVTPITNVTIYVTKWTCVYMALVGVWTIGITFLVLTKLVFPLLGVVNSSRYHRPLLTPKDFPLLMILFFEETTFSVAFILELKHYFSQKEIYAQSQEIDFLNVIQFFFIWHTNLSFLWLISSYNFDTII